MRREDAVRVVDAVCEALDVDPAALPEEAFKRAVKAAQEAARFGIAMRAATRGVR